MKKKLNVAIIAGGNSAEREISLRSAKYLYEVLQESERYEPRIVDIQNEVWAVIDDAKEFNRIDLNSMNFSRSLTNPSEPLAPKIDVALLATHGAPGENGEIQGLLSLHRIPYSTGNTLTQALSFDKLACKRYINHIAITIPDFTIRREDPVAIEPISQTLGNGPLFVKPTNTGSSIGISRVEDLKDLKNALLNAFTYGETVIIEKEIVGTEVTAGVARLNGKTIPLPITKIVPPEKDKFFNYTNKYDNSTKEITPAPIDPDLYISIQKLSVRIFDYLGCKGFARIDYIIQNKTPYFLEINTIPGMTRESIVPKQVTAAGFTHLHFIEGIIQDAINETEKK